jgi:hypothetical protein
VVVMVFGAGHKVSPGIRCPGTVVSLEWLQPISIW